MMSPLFMDTGYELQSPDSLSAEERSSNAARSETGREGKQTGNTGNKRQDKNRDAARKSRKKQTERADELHEELQCLEQSNSALRKEISSLKKNLHLYTTALEHHEPFCHLRESASSSNSSTGPSASPSADCQSGTSPLRTSSSSKATVSLLSTSLTPSLGLPTHDCVKSMLTSSPNAAPAATTLASSAGLLTSSGHITVPYSGSFSSVPSLHSLFSQDPPSLVTPRPTNAAPVCTGFISSQVLSGSVNALPQYAGKGNVHGKCSVSKNERNAGLGPAVMDSSVIKQASFPSNGVPCHPESTGQVAQRSPMNIPQLLPGHLTANPNDSSPVFLSRAPAFSSRPVTANPTSLLSLLTVPSPLNAEPPVSSSIFHGHVSQLQPLTQLLAEPPRDLSLSELLEVNDWILE